jgi:hypothetical protein
MINTLKIGINLSYILKLWVVPRRKCPHSIIKISQLMLFREIIVFGFEDLTKHKNILCGQNAEFVIIKTGCL